MLYIVDMSTYVFTNSSHPVLKAPRVLEVPKCTLEPPKVLEVPKCTLEPPRALEVPKCTLEPPRCILKAPQLYI